jgi:hypothetical protein
MQDMYGQHVLTQFKPEMEGLFGILVNVLGYFRLTAGEPTDHGGCEVWEEQMRSFQVHFKALVQATK